MAVILASSCLLGCECRYKGDGCKCDALIKLAESNTIIGVCPEQMGGLPTPRDPAERQGDKVISCAGKDVLDIGVPVLSMHAPFEVVSKLDVYMAYKGFKAFFDEK